MSNTPYAMLAMAVQAAFHEARMISRPENESRAKTRQCLEQAIHGLVRELAPALIIEVGAHAAEFSIRCRQVLPDARIVAIEAHPQVFAKHHKRVTDAGVTYLHNAVAAEMGELELRVPVRRKDGREAATMGSLLAGPSTTDHAVYKVEAAPLDAWLGQDAGKPNVLWIDVEGGLGPVLAGARATLATTQALYVEMEHIERWPGQLLDRDVIAILAESGLVPVLRDVQRKDWQYNALFVRESLIADERVSRMMTGFFDALFTEAEATEPVAQAS